MCVCGGGGTNYRYFACANACALLLHVPVLVLVILLVLQSRHHFTLSWLLCSATTAPADVAERRTQRALVRWSRRLRVVGCAGGHRCRGRTYLGTGPAHHTAIIWAGLGRTEQPQPDSNRCDLGNQWRSGLRLRQPGCDGRRCSGRHCCGHELCTAAVFRLCLPRVPPLIRGATA